MEREGYYFFNWDIAMKSQKYVSGSQRCDLCICEKLLIARADPNFSIKCRHIYKFTLKCFEDRSDSLYYFV